MMSSVKNKKRASKRFSNPIRLESNNKDRRDQIGGDISKRASVPPRLPSQTTKDPPTLPLICSQLHSISLDPFTTEDYDEQQKQQQRPLSLSISQSPTMRSSQQSSKRSSVPTSTSTLIDVGNTTNDTDSNNNGNNNDNDNNNSNKNNNNNHNYNNHNSNINNSGPYSNSIENASRSVPSLKLIRDVDVPAPSTPTLKKLQFSSTILTHDTWTREDYDRRGDHSTCNKLTPLLAQRIKRELNEYKMAEMQVHEDSKKNTHFFA